MKSPAKFFSFCMIFILAIVGLLYIPTISFNLFSDKENIFLGKIISSKPKNIKGKQALVESGISTPEEFTFFDTLDDPAMKKYLPLNGSIQRNVQSESNSIQLSKGIAISKWVRKITSQFESVDPFYK